MLRRHSSTLRSAMMHGLTKACRYACLHRKAITFVLAVLSLIVYAWCVESRLAQLHERSIEQAAAFSKQLHEQRVRTDLSIKANQDKASEIEMNIDQMNRLKTQRSVAELNWESTSDALTIITCPKPSCDAHTVVSQRLAVRSWQAMEPVPEIILAGDNRSSCLEALISEYGLTYLDLQGFDDSVAPRISTIIRAAEAAAAQQQGLFMYINSDIVLPTNYGALFLSAARANYRVHEASEHLFLASERRYRPPLLVGSRVDCGVQQLADVDATGADVHRAVQQAGTCFYGPCNGADYFVFLRGFWSAVHTPRFVIGRMHWDSYFLAVGRSYGYEIDLSPVLPALHILHQYKNIKGNPSRNGIFRVPEAKLNAAIAKKSIYHELGMQRILGDASFAQGPNSRMCPSCARRNHPESFPGEAHGFMYLENGLSSLDFTRFDTNGNDRLDWAEAAAMAAVKGEDVMSLLHKMDMDGRAGVDRKEFESSLNRWPVNYCYPSMGADVQTQYQRVCLASEPSPLFSSEGHDGHGYCLRHDKTMDPETDDGRGELTMEGSGAVESPASFWGCPCCTDQCEKQRALFSAKMLEVELDFRMRTMPLCNEPHQACVRIRERIIAHRGVFTDHHEQLVRQGHAYLPTVWEDADKFMRKEVALMPGHNWTSPIKHMNGNVGRASCNV